MTVEFHDFGSEETREAFPAVVNTVVQKRLSPPVVVIGDRLTPLPFLTHWAIIEIVENSLAGQKNVE